MPTQPTKLRVERRGIGVVAVRVAAEGVGLPDGDGDAANGFAVEIEHPPGDLDDFSLRVPLDAVDRGQVDLWSRCCVCPVGK